jgi:hypothetical protein
LNAVFPGPVNPTSHTGHHAFHGFVTTGTNAATEHPATTFMKQFNSADWSAYVN